MIVCVGVVGNVLCFITLVFSSLRATSTCIYMAVIAVLDCAILILDLCVLVRGYLGHTKFYISSDWACGSHNFLFYFCIHFDVLLLLAMTVDRFIVVKFPLKAQSLCTPTCAVKTITAVGLFSFALNFQIFFTRRLRASGNPQDPLRCWYPDPEVDFFMRKIYTWIDASIYSFIPVISLLVLNALIIRQLRVSHKFSKQFTERRDWTKSTEIVHSVSEASLSTVGDSPTKQVGHDFSNNNTLAGESSVQTAKKNDTSAQGKLAGKSKKKSSANTSITVMLLLVSFTFLALTSPVVIVLLYKRYYWLPATDAERTRASLTHAFVDNLMYTNHAVNFLLYSISGRRFRYELKRLLTRLCCRA